MTEHRWNRVLLAALAGLALLPFSTGCGADGVMEAERAAEPTTGRTDMAADYDDLAALYEQTMNEMPPAGRGEMRRIRQMAGQMRHFAGMMRDRGHERGEMMGMGPGHMRQMHRGAMGTGGPAGMADWHQRMAELHRQWAEEQSAAGNTAFAERLEEMAARHESLAGAFGSATADEEADIGAGDGDALYTAYCSSCHGPDGQGVSGAFPPLAGSPWVVGPAERTARIVLQGLQGPLEVAGETYYGVMPSFASRLDDGELAALLTFVRSSWGNGAGSVTPEQVARIRSEATGGETLTAEELESSRP